MSNSGYAGFQEFLSKLRPANSQWRVFSLVAGALSLWAGAVNHSRVLTGVAAAILLTASSVVPAPAALPGLDPPWLGYFVVLSNKQVHFTMTSVGAIAIAPVTKDSGVVGDQLKASVVIEIEEMLPDGKTTVHPIVADTLESAQPATSKLDKVVFRGKVTGDAVVEGYLEQAKDGIAVGGRVVDPGTLKQNPLRLSIRVGFPSFYASETAKRGDWDKATEKVFGKKISHDCVQLKWTDTKRKKQAFDQEVDATSKEINGPGIAAAEVDVSAYGGRKLTFMAAPNTSMSLVNAEAAPLHEGFQIHWTSDAAKDPQGKARLSITVR